MDTKGQKQKEPIQEPSKFIVEFDTPENRRKGIDLTAKKESVFLRKDGSAVINREQLEKLIESNIPFRYKSMPPFEIKNTNGELRTGTE